MPELPEVETIARILRLGRKQPAAQPPILGRTIIEARIFWERSIAFPSPQEFIAQISGQRIEAAGRRGKFLVLRLSIDHLLIHLRMSGDLFVDPESAPLNPYYRVVLELDASLRLAFSDTRKFGRLWLVKDPLQVLGRLGPEPLDESLTPEEFHHRLVSHRRLLKPLLLDQSFLAGLGNIYTDEALHLAHQHPLTPSDRLSYEQASRLLEAIRVVLRQGIRANGASIDWVYRGGDFQNYFRVYRRAGQPCLHCGVLIQRTVVGQRGTYFCPGCQVPVD